MKQGGSWELSDGVERLDSNVTGGGVGFDWGTNLAAPGVIDIALNDRASACSFEVVHAANLVIDASRARVVRLLCAFAPRSPAEASVMAANLGLLAEALPVVVLFEDALQSFGPVLGTQSDRLAPWLVFDEDLAADAAIAELVDSAW